MMLSRRTTAHRTSPPCSSAITTLPPVTPSIYLAANARRDTPGFAPNMQHRIADGYPHVMASESSINMTDLIDENQHTNNSPSFNNSRFVEEPESAEYYLWTILACVCDRVDDGMDDLLAGQVSAQTDLKHSSCHDFHLALRRSSSAARWLHAELPSCASRNCLRTPPANHTCTHLGGNKPKLLLQRIGQNLEWRGLRALAHIAREQE